MKSISELLITTTSSLDGYEITCYLGTVSSNVVTGTGLFSDFAASFSDVFGGRSQSYQKQLQSIYEETLEKLKVKAKRLGANAIIGLRIDQDEISGKAKQMFMITAMGTAVRIEAIKLKDSGPNIKSMFLASDEMDAKLRIQIALKEIEEGRFTFKSKEKMELLANHQISEPAEAILRNLSDKIKTYVDSDVYRNEHDCASEYFLNINPSCVETVLYEFFEKELHLRNFILDILKKGQIINFDYIINLLNCGDVDVKKNTLNLLFTYKEYYSIDNILKLEKIIEKIKVVFPDGSKVETKKGLMGNKDIEICGFCGTSNSKGYSYCAKANCLLDRYGFRRDEITPTQILDILELELKILKETFE